MPGALKQLITPCLFVAGCLAVGAMGSLATHSSMDSWYAALEKPAFNPPAWVFGPVWTVLYILMGIAGWRVWKLPSSAHYPLRILFAIQLALNAAWPFLFFGLRNPAAGLVDILVLLYILGYLALRTWKADRCAGLLLSPYLAWVGFATYLNASFWWLNS